jgi:hypothetical protein
LFCHCSEVKEAARGLELRQRVEDLSRMKRKLVIAFVAVVFFFLLAVILIPNFISARTVSAQNPCVNNLRQLDGAIQQWSVENHKASNDVVTMQAILPYLKGPVTCPEGGTYILGRVGEAPKCSIGGRHTLP